MNKSNTTQRIVRAAVIWLLALTPPMAFVLLHAADKPTAAAAPSQLAKDLIGTWILVGKPGEVGEAPAAGGRLKFFTGRHWVITQADPATGVTIFHHGGTYVLKGNEYLENVEYANESTTNLIKQTFRFTTKVEDHFQVTAEAIERAITPRTKALLIGYPNNPTGAVMTRDNLVQIGQLAEKHDLLVISDEIYDQLVYGVSHVCFEIASAGVSHPEP